MRTLQRIELLLNVSPNVGDKTQYQNMTALILRTVRNILIYVWVY